MKWLIYLLAQVFTLQWPYDQQISQLKRITYELQSKPYSNIEAINACSLKLYLLTNETQWLYKLAHWYLFGYPQNNGTQLVEFCMEFGGFCVPQFQQNETLAYKYFAKIQSIRTKVFMSFIDYEQFLNGGPIPRSIRQLKNSDTLGQMAYFNFQFNCQRFKPMSEIELSERLEDMYSETDCLPCQSLINVGYEIVQNLLPNYDVHVPQNDLTKEDFLILEQQAMNGEPEAQLQYAYQYYTGNENVGIERNHERAREIFGNMTPSAESYFNQGLMHLNKKEYDQAINFFQMAINQFQMPEAISALAFMYLKGYGVEQDYKVAESLLKQASDYGSQQALKTLGIMKLESNISQGIKLLMNSTDYDAKYAILNVYMLVGNELDSIYGCQTFLNITKSLIIQIYQTPFDKNLQQNKEFYSFIGIIEPINNQERVLYGIEGAATQLAHTLNDTQLRKKLYQIDLQPDSYIELSLIELYDGNKNKADEYINSLIRECLDGKWEIENLFVAYVFKVWLMFAKLFL